MAEAGTAADVIAVLRSHGEADRRVPTVPAKHLAGAGGVAASALGVRLVCPPIARRVIVEPDCSIPGHPEVFVGRPRESCARWQARALAMVRRSSKSFTMVIYTVIWTVPISPLFCANAADPAMR
jgi:hypothetical protein